MLQSSHIQVVHQQLASDQDGLLREAQAVVTNNQLHQNIITSLGAQSATTSSQIFEIVDCKFQKQSSEIVGSLENGALALTSQSRTRCGSGD